MNVNPKTDWERKSKYGTKTQIVKSQSVLIALNLNFKGNKRETRSLNVTNHFFKFRLGGARESGLGTKIYKWNGNWNPEKMGRKRKFKSRTENGNFRA